MFESGTHSVSLCAASLAQPWVRPIVRGKAHVNTEFGPKLHISLVVGYAEIERLDFEPFNESEDLWRAVARYRERYGCYPERILADKIYRSRQPLAFAKNMESVCPAQLWANRQKIPYCPVRRRNWSIRIAVTAMLQRAFSARARPLMDWAVSWHACKKLLSASLALPCCS